MFVRDLYLGLRSIPRNLGYSSIVVCILALGIGAASSIFSFVYGILLRPLPFPEPQGLVWIWQANASTGVEKEYASPGDFGDWREMSTSFEHLAAVSTSRRQVTWADQSELLATGSVSAGFFRLLRVPMALGQGFQPEDDHSGSERVVVLGHRFWQRRLGADPQAIGKPVEIDGTAHRVVGVLPSDFRFAMFPGIEVWSTAAFSATDLEDRGNIFLGVVGRLNDDTNFAAAAEEIEVIGRRRAEMFQAKEGWGSRLVSLREATVGDISQALVVFLAASLFVVLIICVNLANLFISRLQAQKHELATRLALGASRFRVVRRLVAECVVLGLAGGLAGVLVSLWGTRMLRLAIPGELPRLDEAQISLPVLGFAILLSVLGAMLFGLLPAWRASRTDPWHELRRGGLRTGLDRKGRRLQTALVIIQLSCVVPLLVSSLLMFKSLESLRSIDPGFATEGLYATPIVLPRAHYPERSQRVDFFQRLEAALEASPGIEAVGVSSSVPFTGDVLDVSFAVEGWEGRPEDGRGIALYDSVTPGFVRTMGLPLVAGESLGPDDRDGSELVLLINETLAERFWAGQDPIGQWLRVGRQPRKIVGVVGDVIDPMSGAAARPKIYFPHAQLPEAEAQLLVRSERAVGAIADVVDRELEALDSKLPPSSVQSMRQLLEPVVGVSRLFARLMSLFGAIAVLTAVLGLYGLLSSSVLQRRHEIGVRMALGASGRNILFLIVSRGLALAGFALAVGIAFALAITRLLASLLYGIPTGDFGAYLTVVFLLGGTAFLAAVLPAFQASKVNPVRALSNG